jgi:hypothetical protein
MKNAIFLRILTGLFLGLAHFTFAQNPPTYTIAQVRGEDGFEGGGADSNNVKCKLLGVVYGRNFGATGNRIQFTLRDATGGIGIFKNVNDLPISLNEGDSIRAIGTVNNFNGLSQLTLDSVFRFATDRPLKNPDIVSNLGEFTESDLVKLEGFQLSNPAAWPASPTGSGFTVKIRKGITELDLRIDNDCNLFGTPAPTGYLNIVGIGGQFDNSVPRNSGYQLLPRSFADITPGLAPVKPQIGFQNASLSMNENAGNVQIPISISPVPESQTVALVVSVDSNASLGTDYQLQAPPLITFPAGGPGNQFFNITVLQNTQVNPIRKFSLRIRRLAGDTNYVVGPDSVLRISILDDDVAAPELPIYPIASIRGNNSLEGGVADSLGVKCKITGTLYGPNLRASNNGIQFTIRDQTGGIAIFSGNQNFGLSLAEGDSVRAIGIISQFNGLSQMVLDSVVKLASNRPLKEATLVDSLSENTESDFIKIENCVIQDPSQWATGQGTGFTIQINTPQGPVDLRIDNDTELFNLPAPVNNPGLLFVQGLGSQFDASIPRTSGYQIVPRKLSDMAFFVGTAEKTERKLRVFPNPSTGKVRLLMAGEEDTPSLHLKLMDKLGKLYFEITGNLEACQEGLNFQLQTLPKDIYFLQSQMGNTIALEKLMVR